MNFKLIYIIGITLLFSGLLWLSSLELVEHEFMSSDSENDELNPTILFYILPGIFPTILGILLIEYRNRNLKKIK